MALATRGYDVTALDLSLDPPAGPDASRVRWIEGDFLHVELAEDFDVILFTRSLHHISPLEEALDRARHALRPGGRLVAEEFAFDRVNLPTARWYYDLEAVLLASGILAPEPDAIEPNTIETGGNPLGRWRREHRHDPPIHGGHAMLAAARERFELSPIEETPYLYRNVCDRVEVSERGVRTARTVLEIERRLIRERDVAAAGLRMIGTRAD